MSLVFTKPSKGNSKKRHSIYIGGKVDAKSRPKLQQWGVTHILNMTPQKDSSVQSGVPNYFESKRFAYWIRVYGAPTTNLLDYAPQIVSFISRGLNYGSVLVHCNRGVSRSTSAVLFYLMKEQGMGLESAISLCKSRRSFVNPIPAFLTPVKEYEVSCQEKGLICNRGAEGMKIGESKKRKAIGPPCEPIPKCVVGPALGPLVGPSFPTSSPSAESTNVASKLKDNTKGAISLGKYTQEEDARCKKNTDKFVGPMLPSSKNAESPSS